MDELKINKLTLKNEPCGEVPNDDDYICLQINGEPAFSEDEYPAVLAERQRVGHMLSDQELKTFLADLRRRERQVD